MRRFPTRSCIPAGRYNAPRPENLKQQVEYNDTLDSYVFGNKMGNTWLNAPIMMSPQEYLDWSTRQGMRKFFRSKNNEIYQAKGKEKFDFTDMHFNQMDLNSFFMRLQEQDDKVASWSEQTIKKIKSVLKRLLIDNEYIADSRSDVLLPVMIGRKLENSIKESGCVEALPAFNCFK